MERYVVHKGVYCQVFEQGWKVKDWQCEATGQRELMAWRRKIYVPLDDYDNPEVHAGPDVDQSGTEEEIARLERQRLLGLERSAARAKRTCRHKIKSAAVSSLLTCTYRENQTDFDDMRRDWAAMLRKLRKAIPGFRAIYAFERQDRGSWHVHAAIDKLPTHLDIAGEGRVRSWDYLRRMWRGIVGRDNGNIDVDGHRKTRHGLPGKYRTSESLAKLAGYVSKYLTEDHATGPAGRNKWGSTQGIDVAKPVVFDMPEMSLADLVQVAFGLPDGHRIVRHRVGQFGKFWMLYSEPGEVDLGPDLAGGRHG